MQPDSLIPDPTNPQAWNRFSYVGNRPINFNDPSGHFACGDGEEKECDTAQKQDPEVDPHKPKKKDKSKDKSCGKDDNVVECALKRVKSGPDYISLNVPIPIVYGMVGFDVLITRDHYNNWYIGGGFAGTTGPGADLGFGWFLTDKRDEHHLETVLSGHSFNVSGGSVIGVGGNNVDPTFVHPEASHHTKPEDFALEAEITTPGGSASYAYSILLYDNGNPDPWLPGFLSFWK